MKKRTKSKGAAASGLTADVEAICRLIDHAKTQKLAYFKGPQGIEFGFRREPPKVAVGLRNPLEPGDGFIP